jgi:hypothetical protein
MVITVISEDPGAVSRPPKHWFCMQVSLRKLAKCIIIGKISFALLQRCKLISRYLTKTLIRKFPSPILYGVAVELSTGKVFPASFIDHGPDCILRHARLSHL